ncbi:MAG: hypothetical protein ACI9D0_000085 [Bacteroidia bacterium]|jgi:hypothetical protein
MRSARPGPTVDEVAFPEQSQDIVIGWRGPAELEAKGFRLRLTPLHGNAERQAFDAIALGAKLGLPAGAPFRLEVQFDDDFEQSSDFDEVRELLSKDAKQLVITGEDAAHAEALLEVATSKVPTLDALFHIPSSLGVEPKQLVLWGEIPEGAGELKLSLGGVSLPLTSARYNGQALPKHVAMLQNSGN